MASNPKDPKKKSDLKVEGTPEKGEKSEKDAGSSSAAPGTGGVPKRPQAAAPPPKKVVAPPPTRKAASDSPEQPPGQPSGPQPPQPQPPQSSSSTSSLPSTQPQASQASQTSQTSQSSQTPSLPQTLEETGKGDGELDEYEDYPVDNLDETPHLKVYNTFPAHLPEAYDKLHQFARVFNTQIGHPEIVIVGKQGVGKSSLVEALLGFPFSYVKQDGCTLRPIILNMINNKAATNPVVTVKRDSLLPEFGVDKVVQLSELPTEIEKRNKVLAPEAIHIQYESRTALNLTIIDSPGLVDEDQGQFVKAKIQSIVYNLMKPVNRLIICVEKTGQWEKIDIIDYMKQVDNDLHRTLFVFTHFYAFLRTIENPDEVNKFFAFADPAIRCFYVSLLPKEGRKGVKTEEGFKKSLWGGYKRDIDLLELLQYDSERFGPSIGFHKLRRFLWDQTLNQYKASIPDILRSLRVKKTIAQTNLEKINKKLAELDHLKFRTMASSYSVKYLLLIENLIMGTAEGNPAINGQTLQEEHFSCGEGEWLDHQFNVIKVLPTEWGLIYWDLKLYGGQQFERLLSEFKLVSEHAQTSAVTVDDVASASGTQFGNSTHAAANIAQKKTEEVFIPLVEQVVRRAIYAMKRLPNVADYILEKERKKQSAKTNSTAVPIAGKSDRIDFPEIEDIAQYPYFTYHVKDLYYKFVDAVGEHCLKKCMEEFYSSAVLYWDFTEMEREAHNLKLANLDQPPHKTISQLSQEYFKELQQRILYNVVLKLYNFFLVPLQSEVCNSILSKIGGLSDQDLERLFEIASNKGKLIEYKNNLEKVIKQCSTQEVNFRSASYRLSSPVPSK